MSAQVYATSTYNNTPYRAIRDTPSARQLADRHRHMLEVESAISPEMVAARGYWTASSAADIPEGFDEYQYRKNMFPILVIPQYNPVGRQFGYVLRPDNPRRHYKTGKIVKYESQPLGRVGFDISPTMVALMRDPSVPLYFTEGSKKSDALASQGLPCISLNGVWGFMTKKMVAAELAELELSGRDIRLVFDNDVMTKPEVADALYRLSYACDNRGGRVQNVILVDPANPTAPAGEAKIGIDDYFAKGGTTESLDTLTTIWHAPRRPNNLVEYPDPYARIAELEANLQAVIRLVKNPYMPPSRKVITLQIATETIAAASRGEVDENGYVALKKGTIAQDYREKPDEGESWAKVNPQDGSLFLMPRGGVLGIAKELRDDMKVIQFETRKQDFQRRNGRPYKDDVILVKPTQTLAEMIGPVADYVPAEYTPRADYTKPQRCQHCNEIHARTVKTVRETYCGTLDDPGCGAQVGHKETTLSIPAPLSGRVDITDKQRARLEAQTQSRDTRNPDEPRELGTVTNNLTVPSSTPSTSLSPLPHSSTVTNTVPVASLPIGLPSPPPSYLVVRKNPTVDDQKIETGEPDMGMEHLEDITQPETEEPEEVSKPAPTGWRDRVLPHAPDAGDVVQEKIASATRSCPNCHAQHSGERSWCPACVANGATEQARAVDRDTHIKNRYPGLTYEQSTERNTA